MKAELPAIEMDMTPMIDIVFQLIIFFMLISDMSQQDLAELQLPLAVTAVKDENQEGRMIVNILTDGSIMIKRTPYGSLEDKNSENALRAYLLTEVQKGKRDKDGLSERALLVRADKATQFKEVQKVMRICGEMGIQIYKVQLAAAQNEQ